MFAEYPELSILQLKINVESEQLCHPILFPPQIRGNYTKFLSCGRWISVKPTEATKVSHISERDTEHAAGPVTPQSPVISNYGLVLAVYLLYLVGFLTGITALAGVVIAYLQRDSTDRISQSHFQDHDFLDRPSLFFRGASDAALCNRRTNPALVGGLDCYQVC